MMLYRNVNLLQVLVFAIMVLLITGPFVQDAVAVQMLTLNRDCTSTSAGNEGNFVFLATTNNCQVAGDGGSETTFSWEIDCTGKTVKLFSDLTCSTVNQTVPIDVCNQPGDVPLASALFSRKSVPFEFKCQDITPPMIKVTEFFGVGNCSASVATFQISLFFVMNQCFNSTSASTSNSIKTSIFNSTHGQTENFQGSETCTSAATTTSLIPLNDCQNNFGGVASVMFTLSNDAMLGQNAMSPILSTVFLLITTAFVSMA